jgi:hypothetical protein
VIDHTLHARDDKILGPAAQAKVAAEAAVATVRNDRQLRIVGELELVEFGDRYDRIVGGGQGSSPARSARGLPPAIE